MDTAIRKLINTYNPQAVLSKASTPPSSWYTDPRFFAVEHRTVFHTSWQFLGRSDQVRDPGQFITCEIGGDPILVIRGSDSILRGFFNVCRDHAAAVITQRDGQAKNLRCPYHGWSYDLTGALVHTPEFSGVANFDRSANGLVPVQIAEWHGWVFVKPDAGGPTLRDDLGNDLLERFERLHLKQYSWFERRSYLLNCNWKVFVDNYLDGGYHVPQIHGGLASVLDYSQYTVETGERYCLQSSPILSEKGEAQTRAVRKGKRANYFWIYPNFMINIYSEVMVTNMIIPCIVDNTEVVFDY